LFAANLFYVAWEKNLLPNGSEDSKALIEVDNGTSVDTNDSSSGSGKSVPEARKYMSANFEIYGKVQGVYFRDNTQKQATTKIGGIHGWVRNTDHETVEGVIQGIPSKIEKMKYWLCNKGSKNSRIDDCRFHDEKEIDEMEYKTFEVKKA